jgi:hypothetical protein
VRSTTRVNINLKRRIFFNQCAGGAGVIQVDVGKQNGIQVRHAKAMALEPFAQGD